MKVDLTRVIVCGLLAATGTLLYLFGPAAAHAVASVAIGAAAATGGGAFRKPIP